MNELSKTVVNCTRALNYILGTTTESRISGLTVAHNDVHDCLWWCVRV